MMLTCDKDDKYAKASAMDAVGSLSLKNITSKDLKKLCGNSFQLYACFLMACSVVYVLCGGSFRTANILDSLGYVSCIAEGLGLLSLRHKIQSQGSVSGISGMTMGMYALVYVLREWMLMPSKFSLIFLDGWGVEVLQLASIVLVFDICKCIFVNYRKSYQEELDVVKIMYLIPACVGLAALLAPQFRQGPLYSFFWAAYLYLDCLALLPQVVMMARGAGRVEAPVSHFVAATALSRCIDLWFWYFDFNLGPQGYWGSFNYSGWLIVVWHVINLGIVADFMYYYMKARWSGAKMSEDLVLPEEDMI